MTLHVTEHAVERARQRYGLRNVDASVIRDDVTAALLAGRGGKQIPGTPYQRCMGNAIYAWTLNRERIYVVEGVCRRRGRWLRVVTALPGRWGAEHLPERRAA